MKQFCKRMTALLLAIMLAGVFPVLAETYTEYSSGLTVAGMRAADGNDTDLYVCIDGNWVDIGDAKTVIAGLYSTYTAIPLAQLTAAYSAYGFAESSYDRYSTLFATTSNGKTTPTVEYSTTYPSTTHLPVYGPAGNAPYGVYYTPSWPAGTRDEYSKAELAQTNSFYTLTVEGLSADELAAVDYGTAYSANGKHLVFTGGTATITVPTNAMWRISGNHDPFTTADAGNGKTTYTIPNVTGPITMKLDDKVTVTVNIRDLTGNVVSTTEYKVPAGSSLSTEAINSAPAGSTWYTADRTVIDNIASHTFNADTTLTVSPTPYFGEGYTAHFFVHIDGAWQDVWQADALFGASSDRYMVTLEQMLAAFSDYGFTRENYGYAQERRIGQNGLAEDTIWGDTNHQQHIGTWAYPLGYKTGGSQYAVYYLPNQTENFNGTNRDTMGGNNGFHTVTLTQLPGNVTTEILLEDDTNLSQYLADLGDTTLPGWSAPVSAMNWYKDINNTALAATDTVATVQELWAKKAVVSITLEQHGYDGSIISQETVEIPSGGTLPAETVAKYNSAYKWYDEDGYLVDSLASQIFEDDAVLTTEPPVQNYTARFFVYLDGRWQKVGETNELYGPYDTNYANRFLVRASQLEEAFGDYGFEASSYTNAYDRRFAYVKKDGVNVWADTTSLVYYGEWVLPLGGDAVTDIYYLPHNTVDVKGTNVNDEALTSANSFHTVTLTEEETGATYEVILDDTTNLTTYLAGLGDTVLPGWAYPVSQHTWLDSDTDAALAAADTPATVQNLLGQVPRVKVTLVDTDNTFLGEFDVIQGTKLANWLADHADTVLADGRTIHGYRWELLNDTEIGSQVLTKDTTLVGTAKPVYTVTFADRDPNGGEAGGHFTNSTAEFTSIQVIEGDTLPAEFITRMRANLVLEDEYAFVEWRYEGDEGGFLVMRPDTPIVKDTEVWAQYTREVYVRFWTSREMEQRFTVEGKENQQVGQLYSGDVPSADDITAAAPAEGMRFRYWMDANTGLAFSLTDDLVKQNLDLYPVYERAIFEFVNGEGEELTALHEGSALNYEAPAVDGSYYQGLRAKCTDGTTFVIPNGTLITREYLTANNILYTGPVNGRYTISAEPAYGLQRKIVYHTGDGAQFIIFGAENQESYTVTVDDELIMLGALDIINTDSPIGLALDGWTTTPGGTQTEFAPNATFEGSDALDTLVDAGGTLHLYPVWAQQDKTVAVHFKSNYPDGAVDADGNPLQAKTYIIYIREGSKPTMPTLERAAMAAPANTYTDKDGVVQKRYVLAGWSREQSGHVSDTSTEGTEKYGSYIPGSEYALALGTGEESGTEFTFYAIWVDSAPETAYDGNVHFYIRTDGMLPQEPSQHKVEGEKNRYYPTYKGGHYDWPGALYRNISVVNNVAEVEANILEEPKPEVMLSVLLSDDDFKKAFPEIESATVENYDSFWFVDWYACKYVWCPDMMHYHVDGRVRFSSQVELNYHGNGGTNVPPGTVHKTDSTADVNLTNEPTRENFIFIGWDEDPAARIPDYPANGMTFPDSPNLDEIFMDKDKDLYAIWRPTSITIPMDDDFKGQKYEQANQGAPTTPQEGRRYQFTIEAVTLPEGAEPYAKRTVTSKTDGSFTFPQINVTTAGMYVFEVREVIGDLAVQYDTSVYRLTINIVQSDYGLGIAGYSFTRNNKIIPVTDNNVDNVVFTFTNRTDLRDVKVRKVWDDQNNQDGLRPGLVTVTLLREGDSLFDETVTLNAAGGWEYTWNGLEIKADNGEIFQYYVVENPVAGYITDYSGDMNSEIVITNTHEPAKADFHVVKSWFDKNNASGMRPETLEYTITGRNTQDVIVKTASSGPVAEPWSYTFEDLPLYAGGVAITYTLTEATPEGYESSVSSYANSTGDGGLTYSVINRQTHTNATVTKQVEGNAANQADVFSFTAEVYDLSGSLITNLPAGEGYTVNADGTLSFELGHGESVNLQMLPIGGKLKVTEHEHASVYSAAWQPEGEGTGNTRTYPIASGMAITVTNTRNVEIQTGLVVETEPYLLLMSLVLLGLLGWQYRRRRV